MIYNYLFYKNSIYYLYRRDNLLLIFDRFEYVISTVECAFQSSFRYKFIYSKRHLLKVNVLTSKLLVYNKNYVK